MTSPDGVSPDGSLGIGMFAARQAETEEQAAANATDGAWQGSWNGAQANMQTEFISAPLFGGEVARIHNRIDELVIGTERAIRYTYSESDVWTKHPAGYKAEVAVFSAATSGSPGTSSGGPGGFSGGWQYEEFSGSAYADLPTNVAVTVGSGTQSGDDSPAGGSSFGTFVTSDGATRTGYGTGNRSYRMRGGTGRTNNSGGTAGSDGPFHLGGSVGTNGPGGNGFSVDVGQVGNGSAGGGGGNYVSGLFWGGHRGGHGGWPGGPGGGGGSGSVGGPAGAGGVGAGGMVVVTVYVADEFGQPPSTPTNLVVSDITSTSARVSWDASIDDVMVKNYILYLNTNRYGAVTSTYHDFVGLAPGATYSVRVQAVDIGDNASEMSAPLTFTTLAA